MRILQVIGGLAPRYGGPSVYCPSLCKELARRGHEVAIYTTNVDGPGVLDVPCCEPVFDGGAEIRYFPAWGFTWRNPVSPPLWRALKERIPQCDVVHIYSVYLIGLTAAAYLCQRAGVPYVVHPHGTLDPYLLRRHASRKRVYTALFERRKFRNAAAIIFGTSEEAGLAHPWLARQLGDPGRTRWPRCAVIPCGVASQWFEKPRPAAFHSLLRRFPEFAGKRLVVFYGRINFKKGLDLLARAFAEVARQRPEAHLVLAGPDNEGYGQQVRQWLEEEGLAGQTTWTGMLLGDEQYALLHSAAVFVLPSYSENFGQAVAEAMACGTPVVVSDHVNLCSGIAEAQAGVVVRCEAAETAKAILTLLENPALGRAMGLRGRRLVKERFTWDVVSAQMLQLYAEVAGAAEVASVCA